MHLKVTPAKSRSQCVNYALDLVMIIVGKQSMYGFFTFHKLDMRIPDCFRMRNHFQDAIPLAVEDVDVYCKCKMLQNLWCIDV